MDRNTKKRIVATTAITMSIVLLTLCLVVVLLLLTTTTNEIVQEVEGKAVVVPVDMVVGLSMVSMKHNCIIQLRQ